METQIKTSEEEKRELLIDQLEAQFNGEPWNGRPAPLTAEEKYELTEI